MTRIHADELRPGDIVALDGERHRIACVDLRAGWAWPIARDDDGWAMALGHSLVDVFRDAA